MSVMAELSDRLGARSYAMGEVCRLLDVRPHTVRYWEKVVPFLSARRSAFGRRAFTTRDVSLLYRMRHLIRDSHYTIEGASERLWSELSDDEQDARGRIGAMRAELLEARSRLQRRRARDASAATPGSVRAGRRRARPAGSG